MTDLPIELQVWSAKQCAAYCGVEHKTFLKHTQFKRGFPDRLPGEKMHPRWRAIEVIEWRLGQKVAA